jgi:hypothetical protein
MDDRVSDGEFAFVQSNLKSSSRDIFFGSCLNLFMWMRSPSSGSSVAQRSHNSLAAGSALPTITQKNTFNQAEAGRSYMFAAKQD